MIEFRQKKFVLPAALAALGGNGAMLAVTGGSLAIGGAQQKKATAAQQQMQMQQQDFDRQLQKQQERVAKQNNDALNNLAKAAEKNPMKVNQAAGVIAQKGFAAVRIKPTLQKYGQIVYDFGHALNNTGKKGNQIISKLGTGLAMGTTMTALGYGVDKAIQADRKKITGEDIQKSELSPEEKKKRRNKTLAKVGAGALALGGTFLAARKGVLGKGMQELSKGNKAVFENGKTTYTKIDNLGKNLAKEYGKGFKEQFISTDKEGKNHLNKLGVGITLGLPALSTIGYLGERGQLKRQAQAQQDQDQQRQYAESQEESLRGKAKSVLKKVAIGGTAAAAAIAAGRRGAFGAKTGRYLNDWYMSRGNQINKITGGKFGNKMMQSGSELWDKFNKKVVTKNTEKIADIKANPTKRRRLFDLFRGEGARGELNLKRQEKLQKGVDKFGNLTGRQRLADVQSGKVHTSLTNSVASGISSFYGTGGQKGTQEFLENLSKNKAYGKETQDAAAALTKGTRRTLATVGAVGIGTLAFKPYEWGDKAVRAPLQLVDKKSFAYENSKNQEIQ